MTSTSRPTIEALVLAANDVLFDVRASYHEAVREAVQAYLEYAVGLLPSSQPLLAPADVLLLQKKGRFTNYWDLTAAFVLYFVTRLPPVPAPTFPGRFRLPGLMAYLQLAGGNLRVSVDDLRAEQDIPGLADAISAAGGGLEGASEALPDHNRHMLVDFGELNETNVLVRIFQEIYLGATWFEVAYSQPPIVVQHQGHLGREALLIERDLLRQVAARLPLAVVSDRPRGEVEDQLTRHGLGDHFRAVITLDEVKANGRKPVPDGWPLLAAAQQLGTSTRQNAYVGANVGDLEATKAANQHIPFLAIGCLEGALNKNAQRAAFEAAKAQIILDHPHNLKELILG